MLPGIDVVQGLKGRVASHCCINSEAKAEEAFIENECGIKAEPHIFKAGGIDPTLAFCGDGSAPRQVTDEDVILCSDGWQCGRETIFHCTITELLCLDRLPEKIQAWCLPETCSHSTTIYLA